LACVKRLFNCCWTCGSSLAADERDVIESEYVSLRDAKLWNIVGTPYINVTRCCFIKFKIDLLEKAVGKQNNAPICKAWVATKSDKEWFSGPGAIIVSF